MQSLTIHQASAEGDLDTIRDMVEEDPHCIFAVDKRGGSPLHSACFAGEFQAAKLLIEFGTDVHLLNRQGDTPLHECAKEGWWEIVCLLLENGAVKDIEIRNLQGATPLFLAASRFDLGKDAVKVLLQHGAKLDLNSAIWLKDFQAIREFINRTDWASFAIYPDALLHQAVVIHSVELVQCLLENGADVNGRSYWNCSPLCLACRLGAPTEIVKLLLNYGADINCIDSTMGLRPLDIALELKNLELVKILRKFQSRNT